MEAAVSSKHKHPRTSDDTLNPGSDDTQSAGDKAQNEASSSDPRGHTADALSQEGAGIDTDPQPAFGEGPKVEAVNLDTGAVADTAEQRTPAADPLDEKDPITGLPRRDFITGDDTVPQAGGYGFGGTDSKYQGLPKVETGIGGGFPDAPHSLEDGEAAAERLAKNPGGRVSLGAIEQEILTVSFVDGLRLGEVLETAAGKLGAVNQEAANHLKGFTLCVLVMKNGYVVTGESAPADPLNYDVAYGRKNAFDAAVRKIWPILGYVKRAELYAR